MSRGSKAKRRAYDLRTKYGISIRQYNLMLEKQNGVCAICLKPPKTKRLAVDHDHGPSKRVRGALCFFCNRRILGRGRENPEHHERAAVYLRSDFDARAL